MSEPKYTVTFEFPDKKFRDAFVGHFGNGVEDTMAEALDCNGEYPEVSFDFSKIWRAHGATEEQANSPGLIITAKRNYK